MEFELRQCRRTFGQRNLDRGLDIESASVLMGHATTNTTERLYSRMKLEKAQKNLKQVWVSTAVNGEHAQEEEFRGIWVVKKWRTGGDSNPRPAA